MSTPLASVESEQDVGLQESSGAGIWPSLDYERWKDTYATLHMWMQIVGKTRLALSPMLNHWWQTALYVAPRGLTTSAIAYENRTFEINFDFIDHHLNIQTSAGQSRYMALYPRTVADFYGELLALLRSLGINVNITPIPQEVAEPINYDLDTTHKSYDQDYANRFWRILVQTDTVFKQFRGRFVGKSSPVHLWWGALDLAVTRFSGRRVAPRPSADRVQREAYSHECISAGFWPGNSQVEPVYYCYTAPVPAGLSAAQVRPSSAYYDDQLGEFLLRYEDVRKASDPRAMLLEFLQSTYEAGAELANWDRQALDWQPVSS